MITEQRTDKALANGTSEPQPKQKATAIHPSRRAFGPPQDDGVGARKAAGPRFKRPFPMEYTPEGMLREIRRVADLVDHPVLSVHRFDRLSRADGWTVSKYFGGWGRALERAGLSHRYSGRDRQPKHPSANLSDEELLESLRALAHEIGRDVLRTEDILVSGRLSAAVLRTRFGSIARAVEMAALRHASPVRKRSEAECHENLLALWWHHRRPPRAQDLDFPPSTMKKGPYTRLYGTWRRAQAAFAQRMKDDPAFRTAMTREAEAAAAKRAAKRVRPKREIRLSLRFKVLQRDRFRCVTCGNSPVRDAGCKLQVDHVVPFSRGGKTEPANLRTLCAHCNLGRGARAEEDQPLGHEDTKIGKRRVEPPRHNDTT